MGRVAHAFYLADTSNKVGAPLFAFFAKGGYRTSDIVKNFVETFKLPDQRDWTLRALSARARNSAMFWSLAAW